MSTMWTKLTHAKTCEKCKIIDRETIRTLEMHPDCRAALEARDRSLDEMPIQDFVREVVNGRVDLGDSRIHRLALYEIYEPEMPYGTQKARDGDPDEFIFHALCRDYPYLLEKGDSA